MYVKPTQDRLVPDPVRGDSLSLPGRSIEFTQYWQRRLKDGDVVTANAPTDSKEPKGKKE
jgi:hypothetical protein